MTKPQRLWVPFTIKRWSAAHRWKFPSQGDAPDMVLNGVFRAFPEDRFNAHLVALTLLATTARPRTHAAHKELIMDAAPEHRWNLHWGKWHREYGTQTFQDIDDVRTLIHYDKGEPTLDPGDFPAFDLRTPAARRNPLQTNYMSRLFRRLNKREI